MFDDDNDEGEDVSRAVFSGITIKSKICKKGGILNFLTTMKKVQLR